MTKEEYTFLTVFFSFVVINKQLGSGPSKAKHSSLGTQFEMQYLDQSQVKTYIHILPSFEGK